MDRGLTAAELEQRRGAAVKHAANSERQIGRRAVVAKRRPRQVGVVSGL
jgi:hypothetical protein